jgi:hypothetical protein
MAVGAHEQFAHLAAPELPAIAMTPWSVQLTISLEEIQLIVWICSYEFVTMLLPLYLKLSLVM